MAVSLASDGVYKFISDGKEQATQLAMLLSPIILSLSVLIALKAFGATRKEQNKKQELETSELFFKECKL